MTATAVPSLNEDFVRRRAAARLLAIRNETEWFRCKWDFVYFWNNYWHIQNPAHPGPAPMYPEMEDLAEFFDENIHSVILKGRQIGMSTFMAAYIFHKLFFFDQPRRALFLSKDRDAAVELLAQVFYGYTRLPEWMLARGPRRTNKHTQHMKFSNGADIRSLPAHAARSTSAWIILVDECEYVDNPEEMWAAVEPAVDIGKLSLPNHVDPSMCGGRVIVQSTPKQVGGFFHNFWKNATEGIAGVGYGFAARFLSAMIPPERDEAWYQQKSLEMEEWLLHREYPIDPDLAFIKSGKSVFKTEVTTAIEAQPFYLVTPALTPDGSIYMVPNAGGMLRIFAEEPEGDGEENFIVDPRHKYVIGADTSQGIEGGDFSSADVLRVPYFDTDGAYYPAEQVAHFYGLIDPDLFGHALAQIGRFFNNAFIVVESNHHGLTALTSLKRHAGYHNIYYRKVKKHRSEKRTKEMGFYTSVMTKGPMIDNLNKVLRDGDLVVQCPQTRLELISYVKNDNGSMSGSPHDDCVMSLGMAVEGLANKTMDFRNILNHKSAEQWTFENMASEVMRQAARERDEGYIVR